VIKVPIYKQFHKFVIGKGGANIRKVWLCDLHYWCLYSCHLNEVCSITFLCFINKYGTVYHTFQDLTFL
jgi:hypothetical protein